MQLRLQHLQKNNKTHRLKVMTSSQNPDTGTIMLELELVLPFLIKRIHRLVTLRELFVAEIWSARRGLVGSFLR